MATLQKISMRLTSISSQSRRQSSDLAKRGAGSRAGATRFPSASFLPLQIDPSLFLFHRVDRRFATESPLAVFEGVSPAKKKNNNNPAPKDSGWRLANARGAVHLARIIFHDVLLEGYNILTSERGTGMTCRCGHFLQRGNGGGL